MSDPQPAAPSYGSPPVSEARQFAPAPPPAPVYIQVPPFDELSFSNQRTAGTLLHVLAFFTGWLGALAVYLTLRHRGGFVRQHAATAFNFQLSFLIYAVVLGLLLFVPVLNVLVSIAILTLRIIFAIIPAKQAHRGEFARIPLSITFVR